MTVLGALTWGAAIYLLTAIFCGWYGAQQRSAAILLVCILAAILRVVFGAP